MLKQSIDLITRILTIPFTLEGFTFTLLDLLLFFGFMAVVVYFVGGIFD